jgi:predicted metallo-beta-lactamase superfamily hydrolase
MTVMMTAMMTVMMIHHYHYHHWAKHDKEEKASREQNCFASEKKECLVEGIACLIDWRLVLDVKQRKNSSKDNLWFKF